MILNWTPPGSLDHARDTILNAEEAADMEALIDLLCALDSLAGWNPSVPTDADDCQDEPQ